MQIDDLPRLTDDERELADDEYVVMAGAPKFGPACPDCHGSGLDPAEGTRCERCGGSGNAPDAADAPAQVAEPINRPRFTRLATLFVAVVTALAMTACSLISPDARTPSVPCSNPETCR